MIDAGHRTCRTREHAVTVFTLREGGCSAWCTCGDRFDSSSSSLVRAWSRAHEGSTGGNPPADPTSAA